MLDLVCRRSPEPRETGSPMTTAVEEKKETPLDLEPLGEILAAYDAVTQHDLIPILQQIQGKYGYQPRPVLEEMSRRTRIALVRICGVSTFYAQFSFEPRGRHTIRVCRGTACHVKGSAKILDAIESRLGVRHGQTTRDLKFTLETVACLGTCFLAPVMMVDKDYYGDLTSEQAITILDNIPQ